MILVSYKRARMFQLQKNSKFKHPPAKMFVSLGKIMWSQMLRQPKRLLGI